MPRRGGLPLILITLVLAGAAATSGTEPELDRDRLNAAISQLASPVRAERLDAERTLSEADVSLLDDLPKVEDVADPAVRLAIARIRDRLQERRALQAALPTMVSGQSIQTVGDLEALMDSAFDVDDTVASRTVELPDGERPLWQTVNLVAKQAGFWPVVTDVISFRDRTSADDAKSLAYSGAFRLVAHPVRFKAISGQAGGRLARVTLDIEAEPKLRPLFLTYAARDLVLTTSTDEALRPFTPEARVELPFGDGGRTAPVGVDYLAEKSAKPPFHLAGKLTMTVAAGEERFVFPVEPSGAQVRSQGGVTVRMDKATRNDDGTAEVEMTVTYDEGGPAFESHRAWVYHNEAYLTWSRSDDDQPPTRIDREAGFSTLATSDGGVKLAYRFAGIPDDARAIAFNYEAPTKIIDLPIEFEMTGLQASKASPSAGSDDAP